MQLSKSVWKTLSKYFLCQFFTLPFLMSSSLRMFQLPEAITRRGDPSKGSKPIVRGWPGGRQDDCALTQESGNSDFTETRLMNRQKELDWALSIISHSLVCTQCIPTLYMDLVYKPCIWTLNINPVYEPCIWITSVRIVSQKVSHMVGPMKSIYHQR